MFSGKAGSGLVIARLPDGSWSAPSCIGTAGIGWGLQIGADITDFVVVLNSEDAVKAFSMGVFSRYVQALFLADHSAISYSFYPCSFC